MKKFIKKFTEFAEKNANKIEPLHKCVNDLKNTKGLYLEFGVWTGDSISYVFDNLPLWEIIGFDSFEGLPEKWSRNDDDKYIPGYFSLDGNMPNLNPGIKLIKGWFEETIPIWLKNNNIKQVDLLHIDCDIYSSTKTVLDNLTPYIKSGTIIVFDEFLLYDNFENHEIKAFYEFINMTKLEFEVLYCGGYNLEKCSVLII
jgi:hypothetical protein